MSDEPPVSRPSETLAEIPVASALLQELETTRAALEKAQQEAARARVAIRPMPACC
jgi:hypothetical protein